MISFNTKTFNTQLIDQLLNQKKQTIIHNEQLCEFDIKQQNQISDCDHVYLSGGDYQFESCCQKCGQFCDQEIFQNEDASNNYFRRNFIKYQNQDVKDFIKNTQFKDLCLQRLVDAQQLIPKYLIENAINDVYEVWKVFNIKGNNPLKVYAYRVLCHCIQNSIYIESKQLIYVLGLNSKKSGKKYTWLYQGQKIYQDFQYKQDSIRQSEFTTIIELPQRIITQEVKQHQQTSILQTEQLIDITLQVYINLFNALVDTEKQFHILLQKTPQTKNKIFKQIVQYLLLYTVDISPFEMFNIYLFIDADCGQSKTIKKQLFYNCDKQIMSIVEFQKQYKLNHKQILKYFSIFCDFVDQLIETFKLHNMQLDIKNNYFQELEQFVILKISEFMG